MSFALGFEGAATGAALALAAAAVLVWGWRSSRGLPAVLRRLRAAVMALLALSCLKPTLTLLEARRWRPRLTVLVDTGATMGAADGRGDARSARAAAWLRRHRGELEERAEVSVYAASDRARKVSWEDLGRLAPERSGFDLATALRDARGASGPSRLWLLSDGVSEGSQDEAAALERWGAPVDTLAVGPARGARALSIVDLRAPDFVFLHSRFPVSVTAEASELGGGALRARLWRGSTLVGERILPVAGDFEVVSATFEATAQTLGREALRVELIGRPASGAAVTASRELAVEAIRQKYRIMYLAGRPSFEYSHLREQLKADPNHELVSFVILRNPENVSSFADSELSLIPFPAQEIFVDSLMQFDLFILENFAYWRFNLPPAYLDGLKRFVAGGGALLVVGGTNAFTQGGYHGTPLEDILPVSLWQTADDYQPGLFKPTVAAPDNPLVKAADDADASAAAWAALPALDGFNRFAAVRPGATVLLSHPTERLAGGGAMPVVAVREFGKGKVMVVGTDSTWRWKLGGGMDWRTSAFYGRFWTRAVQYLTGSLDLKKVKFSPLPDRIPPREPAALALHVFDEGFRPLGASELDLKVLWTGPDGRTLPAQPLERAPGVFDIELTGLKPGPQRVLAIARWRGAAWGEDEIRFRWEDRPPETPPNRKWLKEVADRTGGAYAELERADAGLLLGTLPPVRLEREELRRWPLWVSSLWLWACAALLAAEWALRRRLGYV